ncbi:MAG TPA: maleylpyruvate isomerase N-terminal domain-containing protein [Actinomycetota bacterium]|jgi:hypothetical protein|nr:maleylpyruvate isomerase N-terminal domain-containing protein [Actinomycetota bacterium]
MGRREDLLRREAEAWARLERATADLSDTELARPGYTAEGWAIRDLWWHLAAWCEDTTRVLGEMRDATWDGTDPSSRPGWTDRMNAEWFERSRAMTLDEVGDALDAARRGHLAAFGALPEVTADAEEWFDETGAIHFEAHLADLEPWVERLHAERAGPAAT